MKHILLILTIGLFVKFADAQKPRVFLIMMDLKGKVKQVVHYEYESDDRNFKQDTTKTITNFDKSGNILDETHSDKNGQMRKTFFRYSKDKMVDSEYVKGKLISTAIHLYDAENNKTEMDLNFINTDLQGIGAGEKMKMIAKYDKKGKEIEEDDYFDGKLSSKITFIHNTKNQKIEEDRIEYRSTGVKKEKQSYDYDKAGHNIKSESRDPNGIVTEEITRSYNDFDENDNWRSQKYSFKGYQKKGLDFFSKSIIKREITYFN